MKMHDLGYTYDSPSCEPCCNTKEDEKKHYPHLSLNEKQKDVITKSLQVGETYLATVKLKVTSIRADEYGNGTEFAVLEISDLSAKAIDKSKEDNVFADDDSEEEKEGE